MLKNGRIPGPIPAPEVTEAEKQMKLYKYYTRPFRNIGPLYSMAVDHGPMDEHFALPTSNLGAHLLLPGEYESVLLGYCKHPEGGAFIRHYQMYPGASYDMLKWYYTWINIPFKTQPAGCGNMKYKIWCPINHFTHAFINGKDRTDGVMTQESHNLDMYDGTPLATEFVSVRYPLDLTQFGMTGQQLDELKNAGCWIDPAVIRYYDPKDYWEKGILTPSIGSNIMVTISRPAPFGVEKIACEWVGWTVEDGKVVRDLNTPEWRMGYDWLEMKLNHATAEAQHLSEMLPELYAEYSGKPMDEE
ncbi:MAG: hypothetical protein E7233_01625 [Lachnospiraceae bacterium]|nr:hypothetical protein [Lachnospiraceae bacterium]